MAIALTLFFPWCPPAVAPSKFVVNYTAVLCFVVGLALIWAARVRNGSNAAAQRTFTEK